MASLGNVLGNFNANDEPELISEPIPVGQYKMIATESVWKNTKKGDGRYLKFTFDVIDGKYKGRKVWGQLNLENPNADAVKIARAELAALCRAVNVPEPGDSAELHNKPFLAKVGIKKSEGYEPSNVIKGYDKLGVGQQSTAATPASEKPKWMND